VRIFLTTFTAAFLFLGILLPRLQGTPATTKETRSIQQAAPRPQEETRKPYACSVAASGPLSKPTGGAAPPQAVGKEQNGYDRAAAQEYCIELNRLPSALEECVRRILLETGWSLPARSQEKGRLLATRQLESDELRRVAQTEVLGGKIHWDEAMANAEIRLISLSEGKTQVRIRTRILAKGSTSLPLMRPSNWFPLASTGALEGDILAALETRCGSKP